MSVDARYDVKRRDVLAQGETAEQWAIEVTNTSEDYWTTTFYVGVQGFRLAEGDASEGEEHCRFIGQMFANALQVLVDAETASLRDVISEASDRLLDSRVDDPQHQVDSHADTLPQVFLNVASGNEAALETLQTVIRSWVERAEAKQS